MDMGGRTAFDEALIATLDWWREAGVDVTVDESPRDWTVKAAPVSAPPAAALNAVGAAAVPAAPKAALPATLPEFIAWRLNDTACPDAAWGPRLPAIGDPAARLMIITDLPDREDVEAGALFSGASGRLLDRMLAAIGLDRGGIYIAPVAHARPPHGRLADEAEAFARLLRHHIGLVAPDRLLVLGGATSRVLSTTDAESHRGRLQTFKHDSGKSSGVASFHPRFLLERPACKADAWSDLLLLIGGPKS